MREGKATRSYDKLAYYNDRLDREHPARVHGIILWNSIIHAFYKVGRIEDGHAEGWCPVI
jgi:hypothetical protein